MHKIPTINPKDIEQRELQKIAYVVNKRMELASAFLNTLLSRPDIEIEDPKFKEFLTDLAVDYANCLMVKLGITAKVPVE